MSMVKADAIVIGNPPNTKDIHISDYSFPTIENGYEGGVDTVVCLGLPYF